MIEKKYSGAVRTALKWKNQTQQKKKNGSTWRQVNGKISNVSAKCELLCLGIGKIALGYKKPRLAEKNTKVARFTKRF